MSFNKILSNLFRGRIRYHGNYCGPGWSAGKYQPSVIDPSVPPVDELDAICMEHDAAYFRATRHRSTRIAKQERQRADQAFMQKADGLGIKASFATKLISLQHTFRNLQGDEEETMPKRMRYNDYKVDDTIRQHPLPNVVTPDQPASTSLRGAGNLQPRQLGIIF